MRDSHHFVRGQLGLHDPRLVLLRSRRFRAWQIRLVEALEEHSRLLTALLEREATPFQQRAATTGCPTTTTTTTTATIAFPRDVVTLLGDEMSTLVQEQLRVLCLDVKHHVRRQEMVYQGTISGITIRAAEVLRPALKENTPAIVVVHNHPSGDPAPSREDIRASEQLHEAARLLDIELVDHIILGAEGRYASLRELGMLSASRPAPWIQTAA